ncbi:MAG: xanthine dehydrogenase family protein molybdopterin-binding subunit [Pseudomonadota bacterium]|nr:xanthine dehydrogenase family protein molybdopterin-binding subunit [Pseudomonadota bacterium]
MTTLDVDVNNGLVGKAITRQNVKRLIHGRGRYTDDISVPHMLHIAFVRSAHGHALINRIDTSAAESAAGVVRVVTGAEVSEVCEPMIAVAAHRPGHKSAPQHALAVDHVCYQGEPVAAVVATSRAEAEDGADLVVVDYEELPPVMDIMEALDPSSPPIHPGLGDNQCFEHTTVTGDAATALAAADFTVEQDFEFGRHTAVTLEGRAILAHWDKVEERLTVHHSHQSPYQMQDVFSRHLGIPEHKVRVITPDIGGGFGLKINVHGEELAVAAVSKILEKPVKFTADRLESFVADCQTRDHLGTAKIGVDANGKITSMDFENALSVGPYTAYIRFGLAEGMMAITCAAAPYALTDYHARTRVAYVNKGIVGMFRGVGVPIGCTVTEVLVDQAAAKVGMDPVEFRRINYHRDEDYPLVSVGGYAVKSMSLHRCLDTCIDIMDYESLRADQSAQRERNVWRGVGVATFVEAAAFGPVYYGPSGARVSTQDGCTVKLEPSGVVRVMTSVTDQGQGTLTGIAQIVGDQLGIEMDAIDVIAGDSATTPYGGGAWASRGMAMGGEAALQAGKALKGNILDLAASVLQTSAEALTLEKGEICDVASGEARMDLAELAKVGYFRQDTLPSGSQPELMVTRHHVPDTPYYVANGVQGAHVEVDVDTGFIKLLGWWVADDCGRVVNPLMVDEQIRGGVIQGIGNTLFEHSQYDETGQLLNASLADYLLPMSAEMPDIKIGHVETPLTDTEIGANGIGESGTIGAIAALWCAVNDALRPLGAQVSRQPFTPEHILEVISAARK